MNLGNNLKILRKQKGLSQEQLAERLNVSRQAISKWENDSGLPEVETLISLSEIFECTIDDLLKKDLINRDHTDRQVYQRHYNLMAKAYTSGTVFILLGVCIYLFTETYFPENTKFEFVCQILFLFFVLIGIMCFVYFGIRDSYFENRKIELNDFYSENEKSEFNRKFSLATAIGVGAILFGVMIQILVDNLYNENLANTLFMVFVTIAAGIFVYFGTLKNKYDRVDKIKINEKKRNHKVSKYCGVIMMIATVIYLGWSFVFYAWQISWIVYPIGAMICGIVWLIFEEED